MAERKEFQNFICLGIVQNNQGEVLMIKRAKEEVGEGWKLSWAFPGGKLFEGETREQCAVREVLSETGYKVIAVRQIDLRPHVATGKFIVYIVCKLEEEKPVTEPSEPWEIQEIRWIKPEEIKNLITSPLNPAVAKELGIA